MIFLKKFIANGFKSFANRTEIVFDNQMSGIVGPNGSGKSNVVDAIKWVLGEKSNKELRGKVSEDVIFHGSKEHKPAKSAEITLVFDNRNHDLHTDAKEVVITRKLTRGEGNNEYFLNNEPCRLKDIQDIFLDTGLSKGSLGIISQGTVQWFVDAKPEDRRAIFEDAAGIGLYSKRREEQLRMLARTDENLARITDITNELKNQLKKLQRQADKAKIYAEKAKELKQLDLIITVKDLAYYQERLKTIKTDVEQAKDKLEVFGPNIKELQQSLKFAREKQEQADKNIESLSSEFNDIIEKINRLEIQKSSLNSQLQTDLESDNAQKKADALKSLIASTQFTIDDAKSNITKLRSAIETYDDVAKNLTNKRNEINAELTANSNKLIEIRTQIKQLTQQINSRNTLSIGVRTILENQKALTGICGPVSKFVNIDEKYQLMLSTALGKASNNIIVERDSDAENAIEFLKLNRAGKATFLSIESIKPKTLKPEHAEIIQNENGYLGIASKLAEYDEKYTDVFGFLLGNVIVADNLEDAFVLSKLTYQLYKVITLDGDLISPGGAITGGYADKQNLVQTVDPQKVLDELNAKYPTINDAYLQYKGEFDKVVADLNETNTKISEKKILLSRYEETLRSNENQLIKYEGDYNQLVKSNDLKEKQAKFDENTLDQKIASLTSRKNKINEDLIVYRNQRTEFKSQVFDQEAKLNEIRFQHDKARDLVAKHEVDKVKCESVIENAKNKINSEYKMTLDYAIANYTQELPISDQEARDTIYKLKDEIARLGPINMEALGELEGISERYETMSAQQAELEKAKKDVETAIAEIDAKAKDAFAQTIEKVNANLPAVFKYLLGGGNCTVEYTDPENVLTSGIDVTVAPLGKNVTRLSLLSGGEKSLVALSILFTILNIKALPLILLDEAESALDPANVIRFATMIKEHSEKKTQFLVITHRPGTMEKCDTLFGATMQQKGVTSIYTVELEQAKKYGSDKPEGDK